MATTRKSTSVTASELLHAYKDNADAANAKYKGKVLKVTGQVNKCGRGTVNHEGDIVDEAWMDLTAKGETSAGPRVTCRFDAAQMDHTDAAVVGTQVISCRAPASASRCTMPSWITAR